jgi:hypothetical protein
MRPKKQLIRPDLVEISPIEKRKILSKRSKISETSKMLLVSQTRTPSIVDLELLKRKLSSI